MADLSELQSAGVTKIAGANSVSGIEDYYVNVDPNGNMNVVDLSTALTGSAVPTSASYLSAKNPSGMLTGLNVDPAGQLQVKDGINIAAVYGAISVTTTAVEAKVGASRLANRKMVYITPTTGAVWFGSDSSVTILTGTRIFTNQTFPLAFTDNVPIYLIAAGIVDARIVEGS